MFILQESDSEEEVVDEIETPKVTQKEQPPGYANYDSDRSWSDGPAEDEKDEVKPPSDKISSMLCDIVLCECLDLFTSCLFSPNVRTHNNCRLREFQRGRSSSRCG